MDETAIGYNALLLSNTGRDEHGRLLPAVIDSFGDAKSALFVYTAALLFKIFGASDWILRFTATVFFGFFLIGTLLLLRRLFPRNTPLLFYALIACSFLPWFFVISRLGFEAGSQLPATVWALYFIHRSFPEKTKKKAKKTPWWNPVIAGLLIGLSVYSYATARLLSFLLLWSVIAIYTRPKTWKRVLILTLAAALTIVPYALFFVRWPAALMERFFSISYLQSSGLTITAKCFLFFQYYAAHFSPGFLLLHGDPNLRHATGFGGELFFTVFVLALLGMIGMVVRKDWRRNRFFQLLLLFFLLSPSAVALTNEALPHSLRTLLLGLSFFLFSCLGFVCLTNIGKRNLRLIILCIVFATLSFESWQYVHDYFGRYAAESAQYFDSYGLSQALRSAYTLAPKHIVVSSNINYTEYEFFTRTVQKPPYSPDIEAGSPQPEPDTCVIYLPSDEEGMNTGNLRFSMMSMPGAIIRMRCYEKQ